MSIKEKYWSRFADDFEKRVDYIVGKGDMAIIKNFLSEQKNLGKTLELGCGSGTYSEILMNESEHLTASDASDEMVAVSKKRFRGRDGIIVEKADCFNLPYPDSAFDTIFMANLLHIIPEPEKAVAEGVRVLKKDGKMIVLSLTSEGMTLFNKLGMIYRYLKTFGKPSPFARTLTVNKTEEMLKNCGLSIRKGSLIGRKCKAIFIRGVAG